MSLSAGGLFAVVYLILFIPCAIGGMIYFYLRRDYQPIKARSPALVVITDAILILYAFVLCIQRIIDDEYPCLLNVWSSYIGTLILLNCYVIRCMILSFKYFITQEMLRAGGHKALDESNFFVRNRKWGDLGALSRAFGLLTFFLLIPPLVLTLTVEEVRNENGDGCEKRWGDVVLAGYFAGYLIIFVFFGWNLRSVVDGFKIKEELRFTGIVGIVAVIPWFIFNSLLEKVNNEVFPFSTLVLLLTIIVAFAASTFWPLYRSLFRPPAVSLNVPENINTLEGLLSDDEGFTSFKEFLSKEFSVENLLFWKEVDLYRKKKARGADATELLPEAQSIYAKYIIPHSPYEVNLPGHIVKDLQKDLKEKFMGSTDDSRAAILRDASGLESENVRIDLAITPTIFDAAAKNIFNLMETDSYQRYVVSDEYQRLTDHYDNLAVKNIAMREMGLI